MPAETVQWSEWLGGGSLTQRLSDGTTSRVVPSCGGVYVWARRAAPPTRNLASANLFGEWMEAQLSRRVGVVRDRVKHIGDVIVELGGGAIGDGKAKTIEEILQTRPGRDILRTVLSGCITPLYVGESGDLNHRIEQHLRGETDFAKRAQGFGYGWEDLALRYVSLPGISDEHRTAIERVVAVVLVAPATERAG